MASENFVVDSETKDELDEVTDIKIESEDDDDGNGILPDHCSETFDKDIDEEIKLFLKQDLTSEQDVSEDEVTQKQNTEEQSRNATDCDRRNMTGSASDYTKTTDRVGDSSEVKHRVEIEQKLPEKQSDQTEILDKKRVRDSDVEDEKISYGLGIVVERGTNSLESLEHTSNVPGSKIDNKTDRNVCDAKSKDIDAEAKSVEKISVRKHLISRDLSPLWDSYILAVKGIPPKESGRLKQVLNDVLGDNHHRVRPRQKGDTIVYLHFITLEDMRLAKETLTTRGVTNYKLTVTVESAEGHKIKSEDGDEGPVSKKMKHQRVLQFCEEAYEKQIEFKVKDITSKLQDLEKDILKMYPTYSRLIHQRRLQHNGVICAMDKLKDCPARKGVASPCWFAIGVSEETGQLVVGFHQGTGHVRKLSSVKHSYPDHVVEAAEVFEEFLVAEENRKICCKLLIYTNDVKDLMLLVFVRHTSHVKQVGDEMKVFFTSGKGAKCRVTSIHIKVVKSNHDIKDAAMQLILGVPCLDETIAGFKLQLPPVKNLWNTTHGAEMLCQALEELLVPSKKMTVLEIGCGIGLLGLYLSKVAGEVLSVGNDSAVAVATKNATLNGITGCRYFAGEAEVMIPVLAKKRKYDSMCAVVTCCINNSYRSGRTMEELRKIQHLERLVLIEDRTMSSSAILSLNKPSGEKKMGNPFFPSKVVPVDSLPSSKGYVLLVLLERVDSDVIKKFGIDNKPVAAESELNTKGGASRKPYERDSKLRLGQGDRRLLPNTPWERGAFSQQSYDTGAGPVQNSLLQNTATLSASHGHFQAAGVLGAYVGTVNNLTTVANEYELRRQMEEGYRRQMIEEEHRQWLAEEEQRRLMEEMHLRQVQEEEWTRWVHDERMRRVQEEERRRIEEEEWRRRIQEEERMRQIQEEEERMRQIQEEEERMRQIQEEEERMRLIQKEEERMRRIQEEEEERMRRIQEEEEQMRRIREEEEEQMRRIREEEEEEQMRRIQEERMRRIQAERMRRIQEERMRRIQEERMRQIQEEERMRQIHEEVEQRMRRIQEEERRRTEEEEWRRQVQEGEWRKQIEEEQRKIEEEEWRRQMQEDEQRKQIQKEERRIIEEELRRKMLREGQNRPVLGEACSEQVMEEEELRRQVKEDRERQSVRGSVRRSRNDLVQDLIADSLRAAAIPQLSADAAEKVKQLVAKAIRTVGVRDQGERHGFGGNREVAGINPEDNTVSRFGMSDKEMSKSRHMEEEYLRYIREVESAYDHSRDISGGAVGRFSSEQSDLKPQHQAVGTKSSEKLPSLLDLKLKRPELSGENSYSAQHSEDRGFSLDVGINQWPGRVLTAWKEFDNYTERDRLTDRSLNLGKQARDLVRRDEKSAFHSVAEETADIFMRRSDLDHEKLRGSIRQDRTDIWGTNSRNTIGRPEHSKKDHHHHHHNTVSDRVPSRLWMDKN